jgi:hypothetical protein
MVFFEKVKKLDSFTLENRHLKIFFSRLLAISEANKPTKMS